MIDKIDYFGSPKEDHIEKISRGPKYISAGWENILKDPPKNSSSQTRRELRELSKLTRSLSDKDRDLVFSVDGAPEDIFIEYLNKNDLTFPEKIIEGLYTDSLEPIVYALKWKYKRARPFQLSGALDIPVSAINTSTARTPAYPSGHTAYGYFVYNVLSYFYPEHKQSFSDLAYQVGHARMLQGAHYKSDNTAGAKLADFVWKDLIKNPIVKEVIMPLKKCSDNNNSGWKWGDQGKCYTGPEGKKKAIKQGIVIEGPEKFREKACLLQESFSQQEISEVVDDLHSLGYDNVSIANVVLTLKNK